MADLKINKLFKSFGEVDVLKNINLEISKGEFIAFVGPSGCGKSTLLRCVSGLETITSGTLEIDGNSMNEVPPSKRGIAMVFQTYALYPHMDVFSNIAFGLEMSGWKKEAIKSKVTEVAEMLQLTTYLNRLPKALSGGQRQRVAIGRAIVRDPKVFLFDEPLSNLDAALRVQMRMEIITLHRELRDTTMIYVTHDQVEAMTMADRIVILHDGVIEQVGRPMDLYNCPNNLFVAGFIGSPKMNFISGKIAAEHAAETLGIRPEHLDISKDSGSWKVRVFSTERLGSDTLVYADSDATGRVCVRIDGDVRFYENDEIYLTPKEGRLHYFNKQGEINT